MPVLKKGNNVLHAFKHLTNTLQCYLIASGQLKATSDFNNHVSGIGFAPPFLLLRVRMFCYLNLKVEFYYWLTDC